HIVLDAAADDLARGVGLDVDRRDDRRPQHVAHPLTDIGAHIVTVGEMAIDLGLGGARLFGDLPDADVGPEAVNGAESRVDYFRSHLLPVLTPALTAGIDLDA